MILRLTFFLSAAILCSLTHSQNQSPSWVLHLEHNSDDYYVTSNKVEKKQLAANKVESRTSLKTTKKGTTKTVEKFDRNGNLISIEGNSGKEKNHFHYSYSYDAQQRLIFAQYKFGKKVAWSKTEYDASGSLIRTKGYTMQGKYKGREEFYTESGKVLAITIWDKDSISPSQRLSYEYYENGSLKSIQYFQKSKLKYTWVYDCWPEGELVNKDEKEKTTICIIEERDENGDLIKWQRHFNDKGEVEKIKKTYKGDTLLLSAESYNIKDELTRRTLYFGDGGFLSFTYNKKGEIIATNEIVYDLNHNKVRQSSNYKNFHISSWFQYDNNHLMSSSVVIRSKKTTTSNFTYTFYKD